MSVVRDNLTVIVTIRNRRNTLPRVMNYYKNFPARVIFLDSTQGPAYGKAFTAAPLTNIGMFQVRHMCKR